MRWINVSAGLVLGAALSGCGGASTNAALKANIDQEVAAIHSSGQKYAAPASADPLPLAVGQWSRYEMVDDQGRPGFISYSVVGQESDAYWIEIIHESYVSRVVSLMLVNLGDRKNPNTIEVKRMKQKVDNRSPNEFPASMLGLVKSIWKPLVDSMVVDWHDKPQDAAEVPAGSFDACYKAQATVAFGGKSWTTDVWSHPAVPINGAVKSQGVGQANGMQLVEFGLTGAKSELSPNG
ncbi:MAG TPA: hypothetical protein VG963_20360 [Polyangiaceae bacterium]|nr:hypothetical protein [Polyangiaceae bacterium]